MSLDLKPNASIANCAGSGCPEREQCLRYLRPAADRGQVWASFDIERQQHAGPCVHRLWFFEGRKKKAA